MARILLVEDDGATSALVAAQLNRGGHKVLTAGSGEEALKAIEEKGEPDVVVLDIGLPDGDGRDLLVTLRKRPGAESLPAIFLTAHIESDEVDSGRALGAAYLTKPFVRSALLEAIEKALPSNVEAGW